MRRSLLSSLHHLVHAALAWLTAPAIGIGIGPTTSPTPITCGSLTPGLGTAPKVKPPRRYRRRRDAPVASLFTGHVSSFPGMIRHSATRLFARIAALRPRGSFATGLRFAG